MVSPSQIGEFHQTGFLVLDNLLDDADIAPVREELTAEIDRRAEVLVRQGKLSARYENMNFETRLARISAETPELALSIWDGSLSGAVFFDLLRNPKILDLAESLVGPEIIASSVYRLRPKVPDLRKGDVPWHQDSAYFEPYCDDHLVLTIWLALVDATQESGCMWVQPGCHKSRVFRHVQEKGGSHYLEIAEEERPQVEPVCVPVRNGGAVLLTNKTPHFSGTNTTNHVRWAMDLRYQDAALPTNASITRLPGDIVGDPSKNIPLACYPPEADFLVRSQKRPQEVVATAEEFHRLRTTYKALPWVGKRP